MRCVATMLGAGNELSAEAAGCTLVASVRDELAPYLATVVCVVRDEHLEVGHDLADVLTATAAGIVGGDLTLAVEAPASALGLDDDLARRYVDGLADPVDGLVVDGAVDPAALRTVLDLRRHWLPRGSRRPGRAGRRPGRPRPRGPAVSEAPASRISPLRLLQVTTLVSTLDRFAMPPMLVVIAAGLDVPLTQVVTAAGAYFLVYGLGQPLWGFASDRYGRVRAAAGEPGRGRPAQPGLRAVPHRAGARHPARAGRRLLRRGVPLALIYLGDTVAPALRQKAITGLMVGVAVGTAVASAGAGLLADVATWRLPFLLTGSAALVLSVLLARLPEPAVSGTRTTARVSLAAISRSRVTLLVLLFALVEGVVLLGSLTLLPTAVESSGASTTVAGAVTGVYGLAVLLASTSVGRLSLAWHPARLILLGGGCASLATGLIATSQRPAVAVVVAALLGIAWPAMHSSLQTWATEVLPGVRAAVVVSLFAASLFVGSALGAIVVAGLVDAGRFAVVFGAYAALAVPLGIGAWAARRRWHRPVERPEP